MADIRKILSGFSYGAISPKLAAQVGFEGYDRAVQVADNVLSIPQGGFTRRFGTRFIAKLATIDYRFTESNSFIYDDSATYVLAFEDLSLKLYLENILVATVVTPYPKEIVSSINVVQLVNRLIFLTTNFQSRQLVRSANAANIITGVDAVNNYITVTNALNPGDILPITFTTGGTLPASTPQIFVNTLYYARVINANNIRVFSTTFDAANNINFYTISAVGAGVSNVIVQNTWTLSAINFANKPTFDFDAFPTYSAPGFTFTASAVNGTLAALCTITASGNVFTADMVGGIFAGNDGILRITAFVSATQVRGTTYVNFLNTTAFAGSNAYLGEPAWSDTRGWPICGTFFQERFWVGGTRSIPHGTWGSVTFQAYDFDDSEKLADNAITWYPSSGASNVIKAMSSAKSLIVHTSNGNMSTPLTSETPLTPSNFTLSFQNKDGISNITPIFIDNQIIYVDRSGENAKTMAWDIVQSSYENDNISLASEHLLTTPIDMSIYVEPAFTDGYFVLFVNRAGTLAIYNTLTGQSIKGWTSANTSQTYTDGAFRNVTSTINRTWFTVERSIATAQAPSLINGGFLPPANTLQTAVPHGLAINTGTLVTFTTAGVLPAMVPALNITDYFWARGITATTFKVYSNKTDADADTNPFVVVGFGAASNVVPWPFVTALYLEEADFTSNSDSSKKYVFTVPTTALTGLQHLNGETVYAVRDGFKISQHIVPQSGTITLPEATLTATVGLPFQSEIVPLPVNVNTQSGPSLYNPIRIRKFFVHYYNTTGATLQGFTMATSTIQNLINGDQGVPSSGVFSYNTMEQWDVFKYRISIVQSLPLPMTILGIGYNLEI